MLVKGGSATVDDDDGEKSTPAFSVYVEKLEIINAPCRATSLKKGNRIVRQSFVIRILVPPTEIWYCAFANVLYV